MVNDSVLTADALKRPIRSVPDFPKPGIIFRDVTTLLKDPGALRSAAELLLAPFRGRRIDKVVGVESRGFIFGALIAEHLHAGFVPARKRGKLPSETRKAEYSLEYGTDIIEIHTDAISPGDVVVLHDDLLATGGTMKAALELVVSMGGDVAGISVLIELCFLDGAKKLLPYEVSSVVRYESE